MFYLLIWMMVTWRILNLKKFSAYFWFVQFYACDVSILKVTLKNCSSVQTKEEIGKIPKLGFNSSE